MFMFVQLACSVVNRVKFTPFSAFAGAPQSLFVLSGMLLLCVSVSQFLRNLNLFCVFVLSQIFILRNEKFFM